MIYFTLQKEEEHANYDLMMLSAAGQLALEGKWGTHWWAIESNRCVYLCIVNAVVGQRGSRCDTVGWEHTWTVRSVFQGERYWGKGWWVVVSKLTLIVQTRQHQEVLLWAFGKIVCKCFILFRPRHRLRAGRDLKILSPKSYKTDDGWLC